MIARGHTHTHDPLIVFFFTPWYRRSNLFRLYTNHSIFYKVYLGLVILLIFYVLFWLSFFPNCLSNVVCVCLLYISSVTKQVNQVTNKDVEILLSFQNMWNIQLSLESNGLSCDIARHILNNFNGCSLLLQGAMLKLSPRSSPSLGPAFGYRLQWISECVFLSY